MTPPGHAALRQLALKVLARRSGSAAGANALASAARRAYDDLARVSIPLIGQAGVDALTGRALHLARQEYPWLGEQGEPERENEPFDHVVVRLERLDPAVAAEGAAAVFAMLAGLLVTFIGEPLTTGLLRRAWPEVYADVRTEEM